ncbi:hypothetical protein [Lacibacter sp. H407]|uniref:hypothetical protein n=1 Tax=Lacibacter sp. H407 TaxID=3133423 RepID=UPI0030BBD8AD
MKHLKFLAVVMLGGLILAGCKKKNNEEENEEELITTVNVKLTAAGGATQTFTWKDVDGPGGNAPQINTISISPNTTYACAIEFLDESKTPAENITTEVNAEGADHQVYYEVTTAALTINGLNTDAGGLPLGITSNWVAGTNSGGSVKITLKHKPGVKALGDLISKGETDVEVTFPVVIQ